MIIDFHTHLFPEEIAQNPLAFAEIDGYFGYRLLDTPANKNYHSWATYHDALAEMPKDDVEQMVIQGWPMESHENCQRQNQYTLKAMNAHPDRFIGFAIVNPSDGRNALREIEKCVQAGMKGIGELDPIGQGFRLDDLNFLRLCDLCVDLDLPMSLYVSRPVGSRYHAKFSLPLQEYVNLAQAKPLLKVILSHWGGGLPFYELMPDLKKILANVYYDTAGSPPPYQAKIFHETIKIIGDQKILFGSNYPHLPEPSRNQTEGFSSLISQIKEEIAEQQSLNNIFYNNANELLNLKQLGGLGQ